MFGKSSPIAAITLVAVCSAVAANAPADPCSLLPAAEVSKTLGEELDARPGKVAPRAFKDTAQGTDCLYKSSSGRVSVVFRIYFDSSPSQSRDLFKRLSAFYGESTAAPGIGDEAYFDSRHALHARKGNVRFFLEINGSGSPPARQKTLTNLGTRIAGRI